MSEVLVPFTEFETEEIARLLQTVVLENTELLKQRNLRGVVSRYGGSLAVAESNVNKARRRHEFGRQGIYAVVDEAGDVVGSATSNPNVTLRKSIIPFPAYLADEPIAMAFPFANPNISAWTDVDKEELLAEAYKQLFADAMTPVIAGKPHESPWTIEPIRSPRHIHVALKMAGLDQVATRLFIDGSSRWRLPPLSRLYTKSSTEWLTSHGRQKELLKGQAKSEWSELMDELNEQEARTWPIR